MNLIEIYTDGSSDLPRGVCSWGIVVKNGNYQNSGALKGTNNVGELTAIQEAIKYCLRENYKGKVIHICADSQYAINSTDVWCHKWRANGWSKPGGIKNLEIIKENVRALEELRAAGNIVEFKWIKGHAEDEWNCLCDRICSIKNFY